MRLENLSEKGFTSSIVIRNIDLEKSSPKPHIRRLRYLGASLFSDLSVDTAKYIYRLNFSILFMEKKASFHSVLSIPELHIRLKITTEFRKKAQNNIK